jgi:saccharopepsin
MKLNKIPLADTPAFSPSREAAWLGYKHTIPQAIEGALDAIKQKPIMAGAGGHGRKFRQHSQDKEDHEHFWIQMIEEIERVEEEQGLSKRMVKGGHGVPLSGMYTSSFGPPFPI